MQIIPHLQTLLHERGDAVAINGAKNAGILAAQILATADEDLRARVVQFKRDMEQMVLGKVESWQQNGPSFPNGGSSSM